MAYSVELRPQAERDFKRLSPATQARLKPHLDSLAGQPRPTGCKKLQAAESLWRIRVGDYRVVYQIHDQSRLVVVLTIAHRREVYR